MKMYTEINNATSVMAERNQRRKQYLTSLPVQKQGGQQHERKLPSLEYQDDETGLKFQRVSNSVMDLEDVIYNKQICRGHDQKKM